MTVAGHTFINGRCHCGRKWVDIRNCDETFVAAVGVACVGQLNMAEANQILTARADEDARIERAFCAVSGRRELAE